MGCHVAASLAAGNEVKVMTPSPSQALAMPRLGLIDLYRREGAKTGEEQRRCPQPSSAFVHQENMNNYSF